MEYKQVGLFNNRPNGHTPANENSPTCFSFLFHIYRKGVLNRQVATLRFTPPYQKERHLQKNPKEGCNTSFPVDNNK